MMLQDRPGSDRLPGARGAGGGGGGADAGVCLYHQPRLHHAMRPVHRHRPDRLHRGQVGTSLMETQVDFSKTS